MAEDLESLNKHIRACMVVFGCLIVLTLVTVLASYLNIPTTAAIVLALCIASVKGFLVLAYFMHLISEKKLIFVSLGFTAFFAISMMVLIVGSESDIVKMMVQRSL